MCKNDVILELLRKIVAISNTLVNEVVLISFYTKSRHLKIKLWWPFRDLFASKSNDEPK